MSNRSKKHSPNDYTFKEELGHGSYSTVYKVQDKHNPKQLYAIKVCSKKHIIKENKVKYVTIEKNVLNKLRKGNHPGVIKLYYTFHDEENLYFVLSYAVNGELLQLLHKYKCFSIEWTIHFTVQIIDILQFIHKNGIIHRDVKPENILLNKNYDLILTDFGAASLINNDNGDSNANTDESESVTNRASSFVGTAEYVSPELLLYNQCGFCSDIWALGCIIFQFLKGNPPFRGINELKTFEKIVALDYHWNDPNNNISTCAKDLVSKILVTNPINRLSLKDLKEHSLFEKVDWNNREEIWSGITKLPNSTNVMNGSNSNPKSINDRRLHVIDVPIRDITITKKKQKKKPKMVSNTTGSIVEWRKKLGISSLGISTNDANILRKNVSELIPDTNKSEVCRSPNDTSQSDYHNKNSNSNYQNGVTNLQVPSDSTNKDEMIFTNTENGSDQQHLKQLANTNINTHIMKQQPTFIHEIPYDLSGPDMSMVGYKKIDNELITKLVTKNEKSLRTSECSLPNILTLYENGSLIYSIVNPESKILEQIEMVNIADSDLSMYDFEFNESTKTGYLILEKYRYKLWFISLPQTSLAGFDGLSSFPVINESENWVACLFKSRELIEERGLSQKMNGVSLNQPPRQSRSSSFDDDLSTSDNFYIPRNDRPPLPPKSAPPIATKVQTASLRNRSASDTTNDPHLYNSNSNVHSNNYTISQASNSNEIPRNMNRKNYKTSVEKRQSSPTLQSSHIMLPLQAPSARVASGKQQVKKYSIPSNMIISSSRYEVLHTLRRDGPIDPSYYKNRVRTKTSNKDETKDQYSTIIASSGASAAFKNLQKR